MLLSLVNVVNSGSESSQRHAAADLQGPAPSDHAVNVRRLACSDRQQATQQVRTEMKANIHTYEYY